MKRIMGKGPLILFDYFFYRVISFYKSNFGDEDRLYGVLILSILQCQNIMAIAGLAFIFLHEANQITTVTMVFIGTIISLIFNAIRYYRTTSYKDLEKIWAEEKRTTRNRRGYYLFLYIILSFVGSVVIVSISRTAI